MLIDNAPKSNEILGKVNPYERDRLLILALRRVAERMVGSTKSEFSWLNYTNDPDGVEAQLIDGQIHLWLKEAYIDMYGGLAP